MYESHFGLKRRPFTVTPDHRCFLAANSIQSALDELVVCVEQGHGVAVVSAAAGTGKTLLCEKLRSELDHRFETVFLHHASFLTRRALLQTILCELNHAYQLRDEQELRLELIPAIRTLNPRREALVLICDEAHQLTEKLLEELRMLSDLAENGSPLVRLVLVGQHGLEETLARPSMDALNQRIRAHICLDSFDRATSMDYIDYRLTWSGGRSAEVFTPEALELICRASEGIPRCINQLCDHALLLAYVSEERPVSADTIRDALHDLRQLPLQWNESLLSDQHDEPRIGLEVHETHYLPESPAESTSVMESLEFGADSEAPSFSSESSASLVSDQEIDESQDIMIVEPPRTSTNISAVFSALNSLAQQHHRSPGRVIEEVVQDRYAAIDGGFPLPEPSQIELESPEIADAVHQEFPSDTADHAQVQSDSTIRNVFHDEHQGVHSHLGSTSDPLESTIGHSEEQADSPSEESFDAVCGRLDDWLSDIPAVPVESSGETVSADNWRSMEADLGKSVCELVDSLHEEIGTIRNSVSMSQKLHEVLETVETEYNAHHGESEIQSERSDLVAEGVQVLETPALPTTTPVARPYRNLFSQLRRKQQGLD